MFFNQNKFLIIDYGSHSIKGILCESGPLGDNILAKEQLETVKLKAKKDNNKELDLKETEESFIKQNEQDEYEYNIIRFTQAFFPEENNYILKIDSNKLYIRDFSIPPVKTKELLEIISFQTEESLPSSIDDIEVIGHRWFSDLEKSHVISFGTERENIQNLVKPLANNQSLMIGLFPDTSMLAGFLRFFPEELYMGRIIAQLDIGANKSLLNVLKDGNLAFCRSLPFGGNQITEIVASILDIDIEKADEKKINLDLDLTDLREHLSSFYSQNKIGKEQYKKIIHETRYYIESLCLEVKRSLLALRCPMPEIVYLSGGTSSLKGLPQFLKENLEKNVEHYPISLNDGEAIGIWAVALGAKKQKDLVPSSRDDFLDSKFGRNLKGGQLQFKIFKLPLIFATAALLIFSFSFILGLINNNNRRTLYKEKIERISDNLPGLLASSSLEHIYIQARSLCMKQLRYHIQNKERFLDILKGISTNVPAPDALALDFIKLKFDSKSIEFDVQVSEVGKSIDLQNALKANNNFKSVEIKNRKILPDQQARITYVIELLDKRSNTRANSNCI